MHQDQLDTWIKSVPGLYRYQRRLEQYQDGHECRQSH
jgi:hypothetical protein